jgi:4-hydroxy-2-oxoheptanedioate aldolase
MNRQGPSRYLLRHPALWAVGVSIAAVVALAPSATATRGEASSAQEPVRLNRIIEQFEAGEPAIGGRHWQYIGFEHRPYLIDEVVRILDELRPDGAARPTLTPVIRIPWEGDEVVKSMVKQFLDQGVMGVIVPHVRTREETERFVRSMRYPPQRGAKYPEPRGVRGWGPTGAAPYWRMTMQEYTARADVWPLDPEGELVAIVMIESREAVDNIEEILSVRGLGAALIGPSDLSMSLGVGTPGPNTAAPEVEAAIEKVAQACIARKMLCGTFGGDVERRIAQGFRLFPGAGNYRGGQ